MQFLLHFSASFKLTLILWPLFSMLFTAPFIVDRLIRRQRITWSYAISSYMLVLYAIGLLCFTLYPIPDNPIIYCSAHSVTPQITPFHWIIDMLHHSILVVAEQLIANIIFFVPLGAFVFIYFHKTLSSAILWGFVFSWVIEITQLTGDYGIYPCSYRLFDVDDLVMNTLGATIGYLIAKAVSYQIEQPSFSAPTAAKNTVFNRFLAFCLDIIFVLFFSLISQTVAVRLTHTTTHFALILTIWTMLLLILIPHFTRRKVSIGGYLVGLCKET